GLPLPGMAVRIDNPEADGTGVIATRGAQLFAGYERHGRLERPHPGDAWFATGDRGRLVDGGLIVIGRRDDVIVSGGEKIDPAEVEEALLAHPAIGEAAVCGLPDSEWGQVVAAALVSRSVDRPSDADLAEWVQQRLSAWKRPRRWTWMAHLPRLANGKLRRALLAPLFTAEEH
nr:long-chain fatty acid--CoA ligase [Planctomycetota bacterium]